MKNKISFVTICGISLWLLAFTANSDAAERTAEGSYIQAGALGMMDVDMFDNERLFDIGPGAYLGAGHNWGMFGLRAGFHYAQMDGQVRNILNGVESNLYGGTFDLKFLPIGEKESMVQPYILAGLGPQYLELESNAGDTGDWGLGGNVGVGMDIFLAENISATLETSLRPSLFVKSRTGDNDGYDDYFYGFMGGLTYHFGGAEPVAVAAAPTPTPVPKKAPMPATIELSGKINFKSASAVILPASFPILDEAVGKMKAHPEIELVTVEGHTDSQGADEYNMDLSQRRANSCKDYFVSKGIAPARLTTKGYGETQPVASNDTADGRAENRRIVFRIERLGN